MVLGLLISIAVAVAVAGRIEPYREGRNRERLVVAFSPDFGVLADQRGVVGADDLAELLEAAEPLFSREQSDLRKDAVAYGVDLRRFIRIDGAYAELEELRLQLALDSRVEHLYYAFLPVAPPDDIEPTTPDFTGEQLYLGSAPEGFSTDSLYGFVGAGGQGIRIANIEYSWDSLHEDLENAPDSFAWGWDSQNWAFHGNGVLGIMSAADNGYGVTGLAPEAEIVMISPFEEEDLYTVAGAIDAAGELLVAGDVLLIEQQGYDFGIFCPVEWDPAVFEAISLLTAKGIHVVEPAGNGGFDLDDPLWEEWFDLAHDSGAIVIGAGASPLGNREPMSHVSGGANYGARVDLQGWAEDIVTTGGDNFADLFYPEEDPTQAYTAHFGGTSGAAAQIASVVAIANGLSLEQTGMPWDPYALRAALKLSALPLPLGETYLVGKQPDMRLFFTLFGAY